MAGDDVGTDVPAPVPATTAVQAAAGENKRRLPLMARRGIHAWGPLQMSAAWWRPLWRWRVARHGWHAPPVTTPTPCASVDARGAFGAAAWGHAARRGSRPRGGGAAGARRGGGRGGRKPHTGRAARAPPWPCHTHRRARRGHRGRRRGRRGRRDARGAAAGGRAPRAGRPTASRPRRRGRPTRRSQKNQKRHAFSHHPHPPKNCPISPARHAGALSPTRPPRRPTGGRRLPRRLPPAAPPPPPPPLDRPQCPHPTPPLPSS